LCFEALKYLPQHPILERPREWGAEEIFGPKREEVTEDGRKLNNEGSHDVYLKYYSGDQIKENEIGGACGKYRGEEKCI
jgi:hypothetical protein